MDLQQRLGVRIKELRKQKGLSQEALALKSGIDRTYIPAIEKGLRNISIVVAEKIAHSLGLTLAQLFENL